MCLIFFIIMGLAVLGCFLNGDYGVAFGLIGAMAVVFGVLVALDRWSKDSERQMYEREQEEELQEEARSEISEIVSYARSHFQDLYQHHRQAKKALDNAEIYFNENLYSPFWDAVEGAASELGSFSQKMANLSEQLQAYVKWTAIYEGTPDKFPVTVDEFREIRQLGAESKLSDRMRNIVRAAQRDFHFSSIFEQRKTQKSIIAGFESFEDVLNDVGDQITYEVENLNNTMQDHNYQMNSLMEDAAVQREQHHTEVMEADSQGAERQEQALEILEDISENIPRRKK